MTIPANIIYAGVPKPLPKGCLYEKTTDDDELVAGRVLIKGTTDTQLKLHAGTTGVPIAIADKQTGNLGYNATTGKYDANFCHDGEPINNFAWGSFIWYACLADGQTITMGDKLCAIALGKLSAHVIATVMCAIAMESASPSGADKDDFLALWIGAAGLSTMPT
ncbi:MAG: hypothetical protein ACTSPK_00145 [Candidatus Heimdallarchaeota archaeon]